VAALLSAAVDFFSMLKCAADCALANVLMIEFNTSLRIHTACSGRHVEPMSCVAHLSQIFWSGFEVAPTSRPPGSCSLPLPHPGQLSIAASRSDSPSTYGLARASRAERRRRGSYRSKSSNMAMP